MFVEPWLNAAAVYYVRIYLSFIFSLQVVVADCSILKTIFFALFLTTCGLH